MSESKTQCPLCHNFENHQAGCRIGTLELELNEAKKELDRKEHGSNGWQWRKAIMGLLVELGIEKLNWGESFTYGWGGPFEFIKGTFAERDELRSQLTTAQQDLAKIAKALRTQQQRYHDLSEEFEGLKRERDDAIESTVRKCAEVIQNSGNSLRGAHMHSGDLCSILKREILSLIPQKAMLVPHVPKYVCWICKEEQIGNPAYTSKAINGDFNYCFKCWQPKVDTNPLIPQKEKKV